MKLADKPCYPFTYTQSDEFGNASECIESGLTFRERLIVALASNPNFCKWTPANGNVFWDKNAGEIIKQADAIIAELEKENG